MNPITQLGPETCALTTILYFGAGWIMGLSDYRESSKDIELNLTPAEIAIATFCHAMGGAMLLTAAGWLGLFLAAYLTSAVELHLLVNLCADKPIACVQVGRVL